MNVDFENDFKSNPLIGIKSKKPIIPASMNIVTVVATVVAIIVSIFFIYHIFNPSYRPSEEEIEKHKILESKIYEFRWISYLKKQLVLVLLL